MIFDKYIFDFDDTIWSRYDHGNSIETSKENLREINDKLGDRAIIISGNTYSSIRKKLLSTFDDLSSIKFDIWADANTTLYESDIKIDFIKSLSIDDVSDDIISIINKRYNLPAIKYGYPECVNIKIKPLQELERSLLVDVLNECLFVSNKFNKCKAIKAGNTTVDILHKDNDKEVLFDYMGLNKYNTLYVGDEIDFGNDKNIAAKCTDCIRVNNIFDTKGVLKLI